MVEDKGERAVPIAHTDEADFEYSTETMTRWLCELSRLCSDAIACNDKMLHDVGRL